MTSLHAPHDYPYVSPDAPWALCVPPGTRWAQVGIAELCSVRVV